MAYYFAYNFALPDDYLSYVSQYGWDQIVDAYGNTVPGGFLGYSTNSGSLYKFSLFGWMYPQIEDTESRLRVPGNRLNAFLDTDSARLLDDTLTYMINLEGKAPFIITVTAYYMWYIFIYVQEAENIFGPFFRSLSRFFKAI